MCMAYNQMFFYSLCWIELYVHKFFKMNLLDLETKMQQKETSCYLMKDSRNLLHKFEDDLTGNVFLWIRKEMMISIAGREEDTRSMTKLGQSRRTLPKHILDYA